MRTKPIFTPFTTKRAFEKISEQITALIFAGTLKPGDRLPSERELAAQFNTGRMVVREALRILEQSGFISVKQGSLGGAFIKEMDSTVLKKSIADMLKTGNITIQNLTEARIGIEGVILELATARRSKEDLESLRKSIDDAEQEIMQGRRPYEHSIRFHLLLAKASKNPLFEMIVESIADVMKSFILAQEQDKKFNLKFLNHHKQIFEAIENRNIKIARKLLKEHFHDFEKKYLKGKVGVRGR